MIDIILGNIEEQTTDAIVNASNKELLWEDLTVNGAIHTKAGSEFTKFCEEWIKRNKELKTSEAMITPGFNLKSKYIINTVGPVYPYNPKAHLELEQTIMNCLKLADNVGCKSISFPLISTGVFEFPKKEAIFIIIDAVVYYLMLYNKNLENVNIVAYTKKDYDLINTIRGYCENKKTP